MPDERHMRHNYGPSGYVDPAARPAPNALAGLLRETTKCAGSGFLDYAHCGCRRCQVLTLAEEQERGLAAEQRAEKAEAEAAKYRGAAHLVQESAAIGEEGLREQLRVAEEKAAALEVTLKQLRVHLSSGVSSGYMLRVVEADLAAIQAARAKEPADA